MSKVMTFYLFNSHKFIDATFFRGNTTTYLWCNIKSNKLSLDEFKDDELINERDKQDYHSIYIELYNEFRNKSKQKIMLLKM